MDNYQYFNKNKLYVDLISGEKVSVPQYVSGARKRFRYSESDNVLYKQCSVCLKWFPVAILEDTHWVDIHNENEIHIMASGFSSYCRACCLEKAADKMVVENINPPKSATTAEKAPALIEYQKYSEYLLLDHKKYIKVRAASSNEKFKQVLYDILFNEIERHPINKMNFDKDASINQDQATEGDFVKISVYLSDEHSRYIKLRAAVSDKTIIQVLFEILSDEIKRNPVEKYLNA